MAFDQCRFAECLSKYEAIWNVRAKDHGNKEKRKAQMQALADECGISVDLAETKYTSLRTYFVKQRRKVKESHRNGCTFGEIYRPSWPPYTTLTFLEKTLDLQNGSDSLPDSSIRLSMVENIRTPLPDNIRALSDNIRSHPDNIRSLSDSIRSYSDNIRSHSDNIRSPSDNIRSHPENIRSHPDNVRSHSDNIQSVTMVDLSSSSSIPEHNLDLSSKRSPDVTPIVLSGPGSPSTPCTTVVSPLPESTMRIPMPESMRLSIKMEDKESDPPGRFSEILENGSDNDPEDNAPHSSLYPTSTSPRPIHSTFPSLSNYSPPSISTNNNPPISSASIVLSSYPITFPHSALPPPPPHATNHHSTPMPPAKIRKRNSTKSADDTQLGTILQDAVDNLRTLTGSYREDTNDDVSGFLKMTGYQLRSIQDPIRRMRIMHAIQGLVLTELSTSIGHNCSDKTTVQKFPDDIDSLELSV